MTNESYATQPKTATGQLGDEASMLAHIAQQQAPRAYRRRSRRDTDDDGGALFRDKAQRLARWHRKNTDSVA